MKKDLKISGLVPVLFEKDIIITYSKKLKIPLGSVLKLNHDKIWGHQFSNIMPLVNYFTLSIFSYIILVVMFINHNESQSSLHFKGSRQNMLRFLWRIHLWCYLKYQTIYFRCYLSGKIWHRRPYVLIKYYTVGSALILSFQTDYKGF